MAKPNQRDLQFLAGLVGKNRLRSIVGRTFTLAQIRTAHELSESGHPGEGKLVVSIASDDKPLPFDRHPQKPVHGISVEQFTDAPLQVVRHIEIARSPSEVFAEYSDFESIAEWMPMLKGVRTDHTKTTSGLSECGVGTQCHLDLGAQKMVETIVHWDAPRAYAYHVADVNMREHLGVFACESSKSGGTTVTWRQYYYSSGRMKTSLMRTMQRWLLGKALKNFKARLENRTRSTSE